MRAYAEWFAWARRNLTDAARCHHAAAAAVEALAQGKDHAAAAVIAQAAALAPDASVRPISADRSTQAYAAWYTYASVDHSMESGRAHAYAQAASQAQARGADVPTAAAEGAYAAGLGPAPRPAPVPAAPAATAPRVGGALTVAGASALSLDSLVMDPGARAVFWGLIALVAPFLVHIYFPIMPVVGLLLAFRSMGRSNPILAMAAFGVNGLALLLTAFLFFAH